MGKKLIFFAVVTFLLILSFQGIAVGMLLDSSIPGIDQQYMAGEIILKTDYNGVEELRLLKKYSLKLLHRNSSLGYIRAKILHDYSVEDMVKKLEKDKYIKYVQPNYVYRPLGSTNDSYFNRQWALEKINAVNVLGNYKSNKEVVVAVLDSGIDVKHPDLAGKLVAGINTVNPLKSSRDDLGHGTHVAGIIGAVSNNGLGISGIAGGTGIKIMPVKVFDGFGGSDTSISEGIIWAVDHGAKVINMSFGGYYRSQLLNDAIEYAYKKGVVLVAAAGNWASEEITYPAALSKVIAVSSIDKNDKLSSFSSYGSQIDVCAPGEEIYSTIWDPYKGSTYKSMSGTSMASPMVSALAALLLAKNPALSNEDVRQIIETSATDLGETGWDKKYGHGKINVFKALSTQQLRIDDFNGTPQQAVEIKEGVIYSEKLHFGGDVDWFKINITQKNNLQVEVLPAGNVSPGVEIIDEQGKTVALFNSEDSSDKGENTPSYKVNETVYGLTSGLKPGIYYIKVFGNHYRWSDKPYFITAKVFSNNQIYKDPNEPNNFPQDAKTISKKATGTIEGNMKKPDSDWFRVKMPGNVYKIHLDVPEGLDLAIDIENVTNYKGLFVYNPDEDREPWYFEIIDQGGVGKDEEKILVLPDNVNECFIRVYEKGASSVNDQYVLTINPTTIKEDMYEDNDTWKDAKKIAVNEKITANFHSKKDEDWYKIQVNGTGLLNFYLEEPQQAWYDLVLYKDPLGEPLVQGTGDDLNCSGFDEDGGCSFEFKVSPGLYYLQIYNYERDFGENYTLQSSFKIFDFVDNEFNDTPSEAEKIELGINSYGTIYPDGDVDFFTLDIDVPQQYVVVLNTPKDLDLSVFVAKEMEVSGSDLLRGLDGDPEEKYLEPIAQFNNEGKGEPDTGVFTPSEPGRYYLIVGILDEGIWENQSKSKSENTYSLVVKPFEVTPDQWEDNNSLQKAVLLTSGKSVSPTFMGIEDKDWFKVYVPQNGSISINLEVPGDIDGVVDIFDSTGKLVTTIDHSMQGENEVTTYQLAKPGFYYFRVYDFLGNSSVLPYTFTVNVKN